MNVAIINYKLIIKNCNRRLEVMPSDFPFPRSRIWIFDIS
jgi:hypothetical protein